MTHDKELCHSLTGSYHCGDCGRCVGYIGCPDCDEDYEELLKGEIDGNTTHK